MRQAWGLTALLTTTLCAAHIVAAQDTPVFRSDVYVVGLEIAPARLGRVWDDLTSHDFSVVLDARSPCP